MARKWRRCVAVHGSRRCVSLVFDVMCGFAIDSYGGRRENIWRASLRGVNDSRCPLRLRGGGALVLRRHVRRGQGRGVGLRRPLEGRFVAGRGDAWGGKAEAVEEVAMMNRERMCA